MGGVPINHQFGTIQIFQFGKCTGKPIINENNQYPKDLILAAEMMKNHRHNDSITIHKNTRNLRDKTRV